MWTVTVTKTVVEISTGDEILYTFSASAETEDEATQLACVYASMVEYGILAEKWTPTDMAFPREQLLQFIQRDTLTMIETMYPDAVETAYMNAMAYVQSYIGNMFNVDAMLASGDTSSTALTLRLALCLCTVTYVLAASPQYAETIKCHQEQMHLLLKGLKSGQRNMGKQGIVAEPNVRVTVVKLAQTGAKP